MALMSPKLSVNPIHTHIDSESSATTLSLGILRVKISILDKVIIYAIPGGYHSDLMNDSISFSMTGVRNSGLLGEVGERERGGRERRASLGKREKKMRLERK